jgi:hypothetical protein
MGHIQFWWSTLFGAYTVPTHLITDDLGIVSLLETRQGRTHFLLLTLHSKSASGLWNQLLNGIQGYPKNRTTNHPPEKQILSSVLKMI